jgi:hypothetical protein
MADNEIQRLSCNREQYQNLDACLTRLADVLSEVTGMQLIIPALLLMDCETGRYSVDITHRLAHAPKEVKVKIMECLIACAEATKAFYESGAAEVLSGSTKIHDA